MHQSDKLILRVGTTLLLIVAIGLIAFAFPLNAGQYQALAGAVQAIVVVAAFTIGLQTLMSDRRDRQVDRVLKLNEDLTAGPLDAARRRLVNHLRSHGQAGRALEVSLEDLDGDVQLISYPDTNIKGKPAEDARTILRFFERANAARLGHTVEISLFHELIGRHAVWLALALGKDPDQSQVAGLLELAEWANAYYDRYSAKSQRSYLRNWGRSRMRDFGRIQ
jgi:hypothetical protein